MAQICYLDGHFLLPCEISIRKGIQIQAEMAHLHKESQNIYICIYDKMKMHIKYTFSDIRHIKK